jgi:hypothetical protein
MGSVVELSRRRPALPRTVAKSREKSAREAEESRRSLIILVGTFTLIAVVMSATVVIAASDSWAEALPMILTVIVFALAKVLLADAAFFGMLRADAVSEAKEAIRRNDRKVQGAILRRPVPMYGKAAGAPLLAQSKNRAGGLALVIRKHPNGRGGKR